MCMCVCVCVMCECVCVCIYMCVCMVCMVCIVMFMDGEKREEVETTGKQHSTQNNMVTVSDVTANPPRTHHSVLWRDPISPIYGYTTPHSLRKWVLYSKPILVKSMALITVVC